MIKRFRKCVLITAALTLAACSFSGCGKAIDGTATVATLNDEKIPMGVASLYARYQQAQMFSYYGQYLGDNIFSQVTDKDTGTTYGDTMKDNVMDTLEQMYLLKQHAGDYDVTITDEEKTSITDAAKSFVDANDAATLEKMGVSQSDVETLMELFVYQTKMRTELTADVDTNVTDDEAGQSKITYVEISLAGTEQDADGNTVDLTDEEKAAKQSQAQSIIDQINATGDPAAADIDAIAKGVDTNLKAANGTFTAKPAEDAEDDSNLDSALKEAVTALTDGQVVDHVITSSDGTKLYVARMDAVFDQESTDSKKESIISDREQTMYDDQLKTWEDDSDFSVKKGVWKKLEINDTDVYQYKAEATETPEATETEQTTEETAVTETPAE